MDKFQLEKYKYGGSNRYTCPQCGKPKCFTRYIIIETGEQVGDICGRCNHVGSCGYELKPGEYYRLHPEARKESYRYEPYRSYRTPQQLPSMRPICKLPSEFIGLYLSEQSVFCQWLKNYLKDDEAYKRVCRLYQLGATHDGGVIFWQQDQDHRLRAGKIMHYRPDGHRRGNPNWVHSIMIRKGWLPADWQLSQCLFGQHLLAPQTLQPSRRIFLVESEKTAILMAALYPQWLWLATGGCDLLSVDKLSVLRGRHVSVFPDSGCYDKWSKVMEKTVGIDYTISKELERYPHNTDLADLIVQGLPLPLILP